LTPHPRGRHGPEMSRSSDPLWLGAARRRGFLNLLPDQLVDSLLAGAQRVEFPSGAISLRWEDSPGPGVVLRGALRVFVSAPDGEQFTLRYLRAGDLVGWTNLRMPRGVHALQPTELLLLDINRQTALAEREPAVAAALRDDTRRGLDDLLPMSCIRVFGSIRTRVASAIVEQAKATGSFEAGSEVSGTQEELATAVGSVREVVGNALHELKREGMIDLRRGSVVILMPKCLEVEASGGLGFSSSN